MFDFSAANQWTRPVPYPKPLLMVDGWAIEIRTARLICGSFAYLATVNDKNFASAISLIDVEALAVNEARITDLSPLTRLESLRHLSIEWATKVADISPLTKLTGLETLVLSHMTRVNDLEPVAALKKLTSLTFEGGINVRATANTLEPISRLEHLEELTLTNLKVLDGGLRPLARCRSLKKLYVSNQFSLEDYAYLAGVRPDIDCNKYQPWTPAFDGLVMLTGKGSSMRQRIADYKQVEAHEAKFHRLREQYAREGIT